MGKRIIYIKIFENGIAMVHYSDLTTEVVNAPNVENEPLLKELNK